MARLKKILVPVDGSECSLRALEYAAQMSGVQLLVINVQAAIARSRVVSNQMIAEHQAKLAAEALKPVKALLKQRKIAAQPEVFVGDPAATIANFAKKQRVAGIVMGNRGHGRVAGLLVGSVALKVIQLAECPVTLVK